MALEVAPLPLPLAPATSHTYSTPLNTDIAVTMPMMMTLMMITAMKMVMLMMKIQVMATAIGKSDGSGNDKAFQLMMVHTSCLSRTTCLEHPCTTGLHNPGEITEHGLHTQVTDVSQTSQSNFDLHFNNFTCAQSSADAHVCIALCGIMRLPLIKSKKAAGVHLQRLCEGFDLISQPFALLCLVMRLFHKCTQLSNSCQGLFGSAPFLQIYHVPTLLDHAVWLIRAISPFPLQEACRWVALELHHPDMQSVNA